MTVTQLRNTLDKVPGNTLVVSDSGWECSPTHIDGVYYSPKKGVVVLTQGFIDDLEDCNRIYGTDSFVRLYEAGEDVSHGKGTIGDNMSCSMSHDKVSHENNKK